MDEVEFARAYNNLRVLIDHTVIEPSANIAEVRIVVVHIRNAMLTMAAMLDALNQRTIEMQAEEDDE